MLLTMACVALALTILSGCGQMGPLTLPADAANDTADEDQSDRENER
jgi:predicted small lipoprotein YifL